jgi:murein L,D-transpeptidase YafK
MLFVPPRGREESPPAPHGVSIMIDKSDRTLVLLQNGKKVRSYLVSLGGKPEGDKLTEGDQRTPVGEFYICQMSRFRKGKSYLGTRWMRISYPNAPHADRALQTGLIDQTTHDRIRRAIERGDIPPQKTALGGGIGIHGGASPLRIDWTAGCVAMHDADAEDLCERVGIGTPVTIRE